MISQYGNISVQKLPPICSLLHVVKWGKSGIEIEMIKSDNFVDFSMKSYVVISTTYNFMKN